MRDIFKKIISLLLVASFVSTVFVGASSDSVIVIENKDNISSKEVLSEYISNKTTETNNEQVRIIVKYATDISNDSTVERISATQLSATRMMAQNNVNIIDADIRSGVTVGTVSASEVENILATLNESESIVYAQLDYRVIAATSNYNNKQWAIQNHGQTVNKSTGANGFDIDLPEAWSITQGSDEVVVGVIDTGIDISHQDLINNIWINPGEQDNDADDDSNGYADDINGWDFVNEDNSVFDLAESDEHGTHMSGIIAANGEVKGVAPNIKIMPLKALEHSGGYTSDIIEAIEYAKNKGVKIINCSFASTQYNPALYDAIASNPDILFVCAAGNYGRSTEELVTFPACYNLDNIIAVSAANNKGQLSLISTYGDYIDVAAPGVGIYSVLPSNQSGYMDGTSCSAAYVSGVAALLLSDNPELSCSGIKEKILSSCSANLVIENSANALEGEGLIKTVDALNYEASEEKEVVDLSLTSSAAYNPYSPYPFAFKLQGSTIEFSTDPSENFSSVHLRVYEQTTEKEHDYIYNETVSGETPVILTNVVQNKTFVFSIKTTDTQENGEYYGLLKYVVNESSSYLDIDVLMSNNYPASMAVPEQTVVLTQEEKLELVETMSYGTKYEVEYNDEVSSADRTYDDYDNYGYIEDSEDIDYFKIMFDESGYANFWLGNIPEDCDYDLLIYDENENLIVHSANWYNEQELVSYLQVTAGEYYYIQINGWGSYNNNNPYLMRVKWYDQDAVDDNNDTFSSSYTVYGYNSTISETILSPDDVDFYRVMIPDSAYVEVNTTGVPSSFVFEIYDEPQEEPFYVSDGSRNYHKFEGSGDFYVKIYVEESVYNNDYGFEIVCNPLRQISLEDDYYNNEIPEDVDNIYYKLSVEQDTGLELTLSNFGNSSSNNFNLFIYDEDYTELAYSIQTRSSTETVNVCLPEGKYRVRVQRYSGTYDTFELSYETTTIKNSGIISVTGVPATMISGQSVVITITATNTGAREWTQSSNYKLAALGDCSYFGIDTIKFDGLAYNETTEIQLNLIAPDDEVLSEYVLSWRMRYGSIGFGNTVEKEITVSPGYETLSLNTAKTISGAVRAQRYEVNISEAGMYAFRTFNYSTDTDTKLTLKDSNLYDINENDDIYFDAGNLYSRIEEYLTPGIYYIDVKNYSDEKPIYCKLLYEMIEYSTPLYGSSVYVNNEYEGYYKFTVASEGTYIIATSKYNTSCDTYLQLYDGEFAGESTLIEYDDNSSGAYAIIETELEPGTYYVRVSTYDYLINASNKKVKCKLTIANMSDGSTEDTTPEIEITYPSSGDVIRAYDGDKVKISGTISNVSSVTVKVNNVSVSNVKTYGSRFECYYTPSENDTYSIVATGKSMYGSGSVTDRVSVTIIVNDDGDEFTTATSLALGTDRVASIDYEKDVDCFIVSPRKSGWYSISTQGDTTDTIIAVYNSNYVLVGYNDDNRNDPSEINADVPLYMSSRQNYYVVVYGACEDDVGEYLLCTYGLDDDNTDNQELELSVPERRSLDYPGDEDIYTFTPTSSGTYTFKTTGNADTIGIVYDENGDFMDFSDDYGEEDLNCQITVDLVAGNEYYFAVQHSSVYMYDVSYRVVVEESEG